MASDKSELFGMFDSTEVQKDKTLVLVTLSTWSISLVQFSLSLTATLSPKKVRPALQSNRYGQPRRGGRGCKARCETFLGTEIWSLVNTLILQDAPFLCIRLYTLIKYKLVSATIVFFLLKNILMVLLISYRMIILGIEAAKGKPDDDTPIKPLGFFSEQGSANGYPGSREEDYMTDRYGAYDDHTPRREEIKHRRKEKRKKGDRYTRYMDEGIGDNYPGHRDVKSLNGYMDNGNGRSDRYPEYRERERSPGRHHRTRERSPAHHHRPRKRSRVRSGRETRHGDWLYKY